MYPKINQYLEFLIVIILLVFAGYLRLTNLESNPGVYSDEGTQIEIAQNLLEGKIQYYSLNQSTLIVGRLPLFPILLSLIFKIFGVGILQLRLLTAFLGILTILILYVALKSILNNQSESTPMISVFLFSIYPSAIVFHRLGFSYHLLSIFVLVVFWGLWQYWETGKNNYFILSSLCLGLGSLVDFSGFTFFPFAGLLILIKNFRKFPIFIGLSLLPFIIYSSIMMISHQNAFIFDLQFIFTRTNNNQGKQIVFLFINIFELINKDKWIIFGLLGFFLFRNKSFGLYSFFFFFISFVNSARHAPMTGLSYYYFIPYFSIIIIGVSSFFNFFFEKIRTAFEEFFNECKQRIFKNSNRKTVSFVERSLSAILLSIFIAPTLIFSLYQQNQNLKVKLTTPMDSYLVDYFDAKAAAEYVNGHVNTKDLVIASPATAWMIKSNRADFQIPIVYDGNPSIHLPTNIPSDRFSYDSDYHSAKFIIVDNIWTDYAIHDNYFILKMYEEINNWPIVWSDGQLRVHLNETRK